MSEALAWGCQLEQGPGATSLIPTTGEPAERAADIVSFDPAVLSRPSGLLKITLPRGGQRGGTVLDTAEGGIRLFYTESGWLAARIGKVTLSGSSDATADTVIELAWGERGAMLSSGTGNALRQQAAQPGPISVQCGPTARLLARLDGHGAAECGAWHAERRRGVRGTLRPSSRRRRRPASCRPATTWSSVTSSMTPTYRGSTKTRLADGLGAPAWRSRYRHDRFTVINQEKQIYMDPAFRGKAAQPLGVQPFSLKGRDIDHQRRTRRSGCRQPLHFEFQIHLGLHHQ
ncbi:MAG: hypothetical protein WDN69_16025 [Aliidongia sp.]